MSYWVFIYAVGPMKNHGAQWHGNGLWVQWIILLGKCLGIDVIGYSLINIDFKNFFRDRIWFGWYWVVGIDTGRSDDEKFGFWYRSKIVRSWKCFPRSPAPRRYKRND